MQVHTWSLGVVSILRIKVILHSLYSLLTLTLLSSYVEYYGTNYHEINYGNVSNSEHLQQGGMVAPNPGTGYLCMTLKWRHRRQR